MEKKYINIITISGFLVSLGGLIVSFMSLNESQPIIIIGFIFFLLCSLFFVLYIRLKRKLDSTSRIIANRSLDALNSANKLRLVEKKFFINEATHTYSINGEDLTISFEYTGVYNGNKTSEGFVFSIESDVFIPIDKLTCYGFDLKIDPNETNKLYPSLISKDGLSKKLRLPFSKKVDKGCSFSIKLIALLPKVMNLGEDYIYSTLSFEQPQIEIFKNIIIFESYPPRFLNVYDAKENLHTKQLNRINRKKNVSSFFDQYDKVNGKSEIVYRFNRN